MRTLLGIALVLTSAAAESGNGTGPDAIKVETSADAVVIRSPMKEGNFLMRLPAGFVEGEAESPWMVMVRTKDAKVRLRIELLEADKLGLAAGDLAKPRAAGLKLTGTGGARRMGTGPGETGYDRIALFVRDGKRFYEVVADVASGNAELKKALTESLDNFTLLNPQGAPEPAPEDPAALKAQTLEHSFYKIRLLKPMGFAERPPDVDHDKGIWKHLRRLDKENNLCEIKIRSHLSVEFKKSVAALAMERMTRFEKRYNDVRLPKKPKSWRVKGGKEGRQVQMSGRARKSGVIVRADYRYVEHANGRTYEIEMILWGNANRAFKKEVKAFWKSLRISGG
ncbi:MAG: hypothetical protein ACYTHK_17330 [Planctomycetota bacterium]